MNKATKILLPIFAIVAFQAVMLSFLTAPQEVYGQKKKIGDLTHDATPASTHRVELSKTGGAGSVYSTLQEVTRSGLTAASATDAGIVTTGAQTFAGIKTFNNQIRADGNIIYRNASGLTNSGAISTADSWSIDGTNDLAIGSYQANLKFYTNNSVVLGALLDSSRRFGINKTPTAQLDVGVGSAGTVGHVITLAATPTANAFEVNSSAGSGGDLFSIDSTGAIGGNSSLYTLFSAGNGLSQKTTGGWRITDGTGAGYYAGSNRLYSWTSTTSTLGAAADTGLARNAAGVVEINNGTAGQYRDLQARYGAFNMAPNSNATLSVQSQAVSKDLIRGQASDAALIFEVYEGSTGGGSLYLSNTTPTPNIILDAEGTTYAAKFIANSASTIGQIIQLAATPTANALEVNSSAGSGGDQFAILANGRLKLKNDVWHEDQAGSQRIYFGTGSHTYLLSPAAVALRIGGSAIDNITFPATGGMTTVTAATNDDPIVEMSQARVATTDATVTTIKTIAITASRTYRIHAEVVARRTGGTAGTADDGATYTKEFAFTTKTGTVTQLGADANLFTAEDQAGWDFDATVSGTDVLLQVTGAVDNNVTWHLSKCEISYVGT